MSNSAFPQPLQGVAGPTGPTGPAGPAPAGSAGNVVYLQSSGVATVENAFNYDAATNTLLVDLFKAGVGASSYSSITGTAIEVKPGAAATVTSAGNQLTLRGGPGGSVSGAGGNVVIEGGLPTSGTPGSITISGLDRPAGNGTGGAVNINTGNGLGTGNGANLTVVTGDAGATAGTGGGISIFTGNATAAGFGAGAINLTTGTSGLPANVSGGDINISGRTTTGTGDASKIVLTYGEAQGSGIDGYLLVRYTGASTVEIARFTLNSLQLGTDVFVDYDLHASSPSTPSSGRLVTYAKADKHLYQKDEAGLEIDLAGQSRTFYSPGSFTVPTESAMMFINHLKLTSTQRATLTGTARITMRN